jgi:hypothetical protein
VRRQKQKKALIPTFSREREKESVSDCFLVSPLPLAGEGRVRVFFL